MTDMQAADVQTYRQTVTAEERGRHWSTEQHGTAWIVFEELTI
jgi:hypothetical protein